MILYYLNNKWQMNKLYFYSKSKDVYPGDGKNEFVNDKNTYYKLSKINNWRQKLSNFHIYPFRWNNYIYNTIEHAFQAAKISIVDSELAFQFAIESKSKLSKGDGNDARKSRKIIILNDTELYIWNEIKDDIMYEITFEKYKICDECKNILINTKDSELWHIVTRGKPVRFNHLEKIRNIILM
jgi:predicted NAD-dependent protein-ADP-ribosyltransferase YbiA (DUF1768 family)